MKQTYFFCLLFVLLISGCKKKFEASGPRYSKEPGENSKSVYCLAVHPLYNPEKLIQTYNPIINYLNKKIGGIKFTLEASRDYASYEQKYKNKKPDFLLPNPWQTLQAMKFGYHVIAMAGDPEDFKGIFIVRKDSPILTPSDVKGKVVSYPAPTALAACIMPQYFLFESGININVDIQNRYVGSQESSIMNVYLGLTDVGVTWPPPWREFQIDHPSEASELKIIWETKSLVNNSVMVRNDVPDDIQKQVQELLIGLNKSDDGLAILKEMETAYFLPATDKDYNVVRTYIDQFEMKVRKIEIK
jgi:phosphonate transport system substrate-binding protein